MKLKGLELQGFKTFPDKTKLDFTNGITAVVGPNGSGKSNISDAIRWVLGEQSAKSLRCSKMEDVIFNGTQQRKRTGYAQVTLSIDNSDRTLQYDGDEVAVTRRFYRSGSSEYLINNTNVRLQDIHELFMDTGLGRDGYSMIGQGKIDSIVSTRGEDRREIFEEAAGISRFRYRKAEAERRLDKTEENLVRLRDRLKELEDRVGPLKEQSEKARAYLTYAEEKRGLEIALWLRTLDKSAQQLREQEDKLAVAQAQHDEIEKALEQICAESDDIFQKQGSVAARAEEIRREIALQNGTAAEKRSQISVLQNDMQHNSSAIERLNESAAEYDRTAEAAAETIKTREAERGVLEGSLGVKNGELERISGALSALRTDEDSSGKRLDEINALIAELRQKAADEKLVYMTSSASVSELKVRKETTENNIRARNSQIATLSQIIGEYDGMLEELAVKKEEKSAALREKADAVRACEGECDSIKKEADRLQLESDRLFGKAKTLEDLERNLDGFAFSVKKVMKEAQSGGLTGIDGPVSRVIKTSDEYNIAIETALGAAMQNIVTETENDAKRAIAFLKKNDGGRATFLPVSAIKGRELGETGLDRCEGFIGLASSLCTCEERYKGILYSLLGRIAVARDLDCAAEIAKKYSYRFRVVTLDGQVVNTGGSLTGGSLAKNTGLLGRAAEIEKIRGRAQQLSDEAAAQRQKLSEARARLENERNALAECNRELEKLKENGVNIDAERKSRRTELDGTRASCDELKTERDGMLKKLEELEDAIRTARTNYDSYTTQIQKHEELVDVLSGSRSKSAEKRERLAEELQEAKIAVLTIEKDIASVSSEINAARLGMNNAIEAAKRTRDEAQTLKDKNSGTEALIKELETQCDAASKKAEELGLETERLSGERTALDMRSAELRRAEREKTSERERLGGELARLEERRTNLQKQYDEINGKLWEEYELTKKEAEAVAADISEPGKAQRRLAELRQKIKSLGSVNVGAIDEYKEVSERYEFMKVQVGDVERSRNELLRLITELTKQMRDIFIERFDLINKNFSSTFVELFGGGRASLSLSDPENVLTTGIEISVEPPGKIVSHIELLSGGEKALVAIALYFAIMKVSPSPFCVMDEIEAALDDVNVYRFASYLRRMNANTQFICITHRRGTMEEADVLYGVTMQDRGISKLLELQASEIEKNLGA